MFSNNCWSNIMKFISNYRDYINILLLNKSIYDYILKYFHEFNNLEENIKKLIRGKKVSIYDPKYYGKMVKKIIVMPKVIKSIYYNCRSWRCYVDYSIFRMNPYVKTFKINAKLYEKKDMCFKFLLYYDENKEIVNIGDLFTLSKVKINISSKIHKSNYEYGITIELSIKMNNVKYLVIYIQGVDKNINGLKILINSKDTIEYYEKLFNKWLKTYINNYYGNILKNREKSIFSKSLLEFKSRNLLYEINMDRLRFFNNDNIKDADNIKYRDAYEYDIKFGAKNYYNIMIHLNDYKNKRSLFKSINFYMYYPGYYIVKPKHFLDPKNVSTSDKRFRYMFIDVIGLRLYEVLENISKNRRSELFVCGSCVPLLMNGVTKGMSDIDIFVSNMHDNIDIIEKKIISGQMDKLYKIIKLERNKLRIVLKLKLNSGKVINLDLFGTYGKDYVVLNSFHLPIVRGWYSLKEKKIYGFMSFIRAIKYNLSYNLYVSGFVSKKFEFIIEVFYKYFTKGFGSVFNKTDKDKFVKYLEKKGVKDYIVEYKINKVDKVKCSFNKFNELKWL